MTGSASFDVCVVGGGPAGSAAAITASRNGLRVLLLDKDRFPRHKVCGEFISFESLTLLESLLNERVSGVPLAEVRLFRNGSVKRGHLPAPAISISRSDLDLRLLRQTTTVGAMVVTGERVKQVSRDATGFEIRTETTEYRANALINAAGRWSELKQSHSLPAHRWIGLKRHFYEPAPNLSTDLYFFSGGYCGVQPIGVGTINVCTLVKAELASSLGAVIGLTPDLRDRSKIWIPATEAIATAPVIFGAPRPVADGMYNVGDAAAFVDPFLGDGISIALQTGTLAAQCLLIPDGLDRYEQEYSRRVTPALRRAARLRALSHSALAWKAMKLPGALNCAARLTRVKTA